MIRYANDNVSEQCWVLQQRSMGQLYEAKWDSRVKTLGVVGNMFTNECWNEVIAVIIALYTPQSQTTVITHVYKSHAAKSWSSDNKTIVDSRLFPRYATHNEYLLVFIIEQNLVGVLRVMLVIFYHCSGICMMCHRTIRKHDVIHKTGST